jgi:hypothetical protein
MNSAFALASDGQRMCAPKGSQSDIRKIKLFCCKSCLQLKKMRRAFIYLKCGVASTDLVGVSSARPRRLNRGARNRIVIKFYGLDEINQAAAGSESGATI